MFRPYLQSSLLEHLTDPKEILVMEGVRQTGKTTAIRQALLNHPHQFITLTDETVPVILLRDARTFEDFTGILKNHFNYDPKTKIPLVIDEAQRSEALHKFVMQIHSEWKGVPVIFSGSAMGVFFKRAEIQKVVSPAGRVKRIVCRPFCFEEFLELTGEKGMLGELGHFEFEKPFHPALHHRLMGLFFNYISVGGFPEAIKAGASTEKVYDYIETLISFFWQDADRYLSELCGLNKRQYGSLFKALLESVARLTGMPSTRASLLSTDSPAYRTDLPILLDAAEEWHFLFRLVTSMKGATTKQGSSSKKYLWDVGVANHFLNAGRPVGHASPPELLGKLLESYVAQELIFSLKSKARLSSWKSQNKQPKEMDFLARFAERDVGVEVKASFTVNQKAISQLLEFQKANPQAVEYVVYMGQATVIQKETGRLFCIPPYLTGQIPRLTGQVF